MKLWNLGFSLLLLSGAAWADAGETVPTVPVEPLREATDADAPVKLAPVTAVATRVERPLSQTAESVSRLSLEDLERAQPASLGEALRNVVGVQIEGGPRASADFINIRGLSGTRVLLLVDGARQNVVGGHRSPLLIDPDVIREIEVLRGPASALYGSDALGGVVAVTTVTADDLVAPDAAFGGRLRLGYQDNGDARDGAVTVGGRLGAFDLVASHGQRRQEDYENGNGETIEHTALDTENALIKLGWQLAPGHRLQMSAQHFLQDGESPSNPAIEVNDTNPLLDRESRQQYLNAQYRFDRGLTSAQVDLYRNDTRYREDRVDTPRHDRTDFDTTGLAARSSFALGAHHQLQLGGEIYEDGAEASRDGEPRPQYPDSERRITGLYLQDIWSWGPLSLVPGVRWDRYEAASNTGAARDIDADRTSLKLGVTWALGGGFSLRASAGEAFRAPNLVELFPVGQHFLGNEFRPNPDLRPETARNVELGIDFRRQSWLREGDHLQLRASVFDNRVDDFIETVVVEETRFGALECLGLRPAVGCVNRNDDGSLNPLVPPIFVGGFTQSQNLDAAEIRGGEVTLDYRTGDWTVGLQYAAQRGENRRTGAPLLNIAPETARGVLGLHLLSSLQLQVGATWVGAQTRVPLDSEGVPVTPETPDYHLMDAALVWQPPQWSALKLVVSGENLGDRQYRAHLNTLDSPGRSLRASMHLRF